MKGFTPWILIALFAVLPLGTGTSYNVLFMSPLDIKSHINALHPIAEELGRRGHQVTYFSALKEETEYVRVTDVQPSNLPDTRHFSFFTNQSIGNSFFFTQMRNTHTLLCTLLKALYLDPFIQDLILHPYVVDNATTSRRFDLVVVNGMFLEFSLPLAHHLGASIVYASPTILPFTVAWSLNIPNPAYVPNPMMLVESKISFWQRFETAVMNFLIVQLRHQLQLPSYDEHVREFLPHAPSISEIERNVSFVLSNSHFAINPSSPRMPFNAEVGGLHCKPAKKLPKDLEDFMQSSGDHGVIYFAFGSMQKGADIPESMKQKFLTVFSELPQKILWKHENALQNIPSNVKLIEWAPQQDILGHPKLKLLVNHGGGLSLQETVYHGKPALLFPLGVEQRSNAGNAFRVGMAEYLDWKTFSTDDLRDKINRLLGDPKYMENAQRVSRLFRDRPQSPAEEAAYWIEYVIRHNGAHHLKSGAENLNYFQYFLLDVVAVIIAVISVVFFLAVFVVFKVTRLLFAIFKLDRKQPEERQPSKQQTNNSRKVKET